VGGIVKYQYAIGPPTTITKNKITPKTYVVRRRDAQDISSVYSEAPSTKKPPCGGSFVL
jgi:hypothetical protein